MPSRYLRLEMLPAKQGDCVLLEWGSDPTRFRMLVDVGPAPAYRRISERLQTLEPPRIDLLVLTHIDADHLEGAILLTNDRKLGLDFREVWFNGAPQLTQELGPVQGEILSAVIAERGIPWNTSFFGAAVKAPEQGDFVTLDLKDGMRVTVLSPDLQCLHRLRDDWDRACREEGLMMGSVTEALAALRARPALRPPATYLGETETLNVASLAQSRSAADQSVPNASSIVLLLECGDVRILLAGDSTPPMLERAIRRLFAQRAINHLELSAFKLPHHGSARNVTTELVRCLPTQQYLFSTDGSYFGHPDAVAVARILHHARPGTELVFNYDTTRTRMWDDNRLRDLYGYRVRYPDVGVGGVRLEWWVPDG